MKKLKRVLTPILCLLIIISVLQVSFVGKSSALRLTSRSLAILSPVPSATTTHTFTFTFPDASVVGSIEFEYCMSSLLEVPCVSPPGLNACNAVLDESSEVGETGFTKASTCPAFPQNEILISRPAVATGTEQAQYVFSNVVNPNFIGSFFAIITTYASEDGSGPYIDYGGMVNSTATTVNVNSYVPPIIDFCVGQTVAGDCSSTSGDFIDFGNFTPSSIASATSQMTVATNAQSGVSVTANGFTMTSGNNTIPALQTPTKSQTGTSQFGINLFANSIPKVGASPTGPGTMTPTTNYNKLNQFLFNSGDQVAASNIATDFKTFTVSYMVNVSSGQPPGVYNTNITFICTGFF